MSLQNDRTKIWTISNVITLSRICLVPVFVIVLLSPWPTWLGIHDLINNELKSFIATAIFVLISCTDWVDGYLARSRNEVTDFGKFMDPLADKILVIAALLALIELQVLPSWPVLIIITREFIVSGIRMLAATKGVVIAASWYGKAKTVTQIIAVVLFLLKDSMYIPQGSQATHDVLYACAWFVMIIALILTALSMIDYISKAMPLLTDRKSPKATEINESSNAPGLVGDRDLGLNDLDRTIDLLSRKAIDLLIDDGLTISTAESLTGGMLCSSLVNIPGSSNAVKGSIVSYAISVKEKLLDVDPSLLAAEGAVDANVAEQMAINCAHELGSDICVSTTGIAGPSGAEEGKPVGTVFIGIYANGTFRSERFQFEGDRETVRKRTVEVALKMLISSIDADR